MNTSHVPYTHGRIRVGTVPFEVTTLSDATSSIISMGQSGRGIPIRLANAFCVAMAAQDASYNALLNGDGLNYPDGTPVVWAMRSQAQPGTRPGQVRGPTLFTSVLDAGRQASLRHFFLGTTPQTLEMMTEEIRSRFPGISIAGTFAPPFGPVDAHFIESATQSIQRTSPHVVWVALGSPKQDFAAAELAKVLQIPCVGVGAAFDFVAGTTKEAPNWIRNTGLEWVYRFASEPRRLWSRYTKGNVQFLVSVIRQQRESKKIRDAEGK